jgi:hypothetical protein
MSPVRVRSGCQRAPRLTVAPVVLAILAWWFSYQFWKVTVAGAHVRQSVELLLLSWR